MKLYRFVFVFLWLSFLCVCVYFAIHNAGWRWGDEAIVINKIGWSEPFIPHLQQTECARLYPFCYTLYDLLLLFPHGDQISPCAIYILQSVFLIVYSIALFCLSFIILKDVDYKWKYPIALLTNIFAVSRIYNEMITCNTGIWIIYTLLPVFLLFSYLFYKKHNWWYGAISLIVINYLIYCYETIFSVPFTIGACMLLFLWSKLTKPNKIYFFSLLGSAIIFLVLYVCLALPNISNVYDPAHGSGVSFWENALKIFIAQKTMWVVSILLLVRLFDFIKNHREFYYFDTLLLASCAYCCVGVVVKLNFVYYYNLAVITAIPAILYFSIYYFKEIGTFCLFLSLSIFYGIKIPKIIKRVNNERDVCAYIVAQVCTATENYENVFWYLPKDGVINGYGLELRAWHKHFVESNIAWSSQDKNYYIKGMDSFNDEPGLWFVDNDDVASFMNRSENPPVEIEAGEYFKCYRINQ